jgi:(p)ppGpp synthase/HD superfamily hydrolase
MLGKEYFKAVEALEYAAKFHTGMRKDGVTPEFHHQISIGHYLRTLANLRNQEFALIVGILHDVVEDYDVPIEVLAARFGQEVADAVLLMSKKYKGAKKATADYYLAMRNCPIASIVKGADRIHNFQTMHAVFTCKKQLAYIEECEMHILPMLKEARNNFPDQELAYENIKHALKGQIELLRLAISAKTRLLQLEGEND